MKMLNQLFFAITILSVSSFTWMTGKTETMNDQLKGAWLHQGTGEEQVLLFIDGYTSQTVYSQSGKSFTETRGGTYMAAGNILQISSEFDTKEKEMIGKVINHDFVIKENELTIDYQGKKITYKRIDQGVSPIAGVWTITARKQEDKVVPIHRTGTRKTLKILSDSRFQWVAIDPGAKSFSGTGGGSYTFKDGKYTEHIEFFSRDSSRVGASLSFDGRLENGEWHHSGKSSKGDPIYEIWSRDKK